MSTLLLSSRFAKSLLIFLVLLGVDCKAEDGFGTKAKKNLPMHDNSDTPGVQAEGIREVYQKDVTLVAANHDKRLEDQELGSERLNIDEDSVTRRVTGNERREIDNSAKDAKGRDAGVKEPTVSKESPRKNEAGEENKEGNSKKTTITSKAFSLNSKNRTFLYKGDVVVIQPDMKLTCKELIGAYGEDNKISKMEAIGDVVIYKENMVATGNRGVYVAKDRTLDLTESPSVTQDGSILRANKIRVFLETGLSQAVGEVRVDVIEDE